MNALRCGRFRVYGIALIIIVNQVDVRQGSILPHKSAVECRSFGNRIVLIKTHPLYPRIKCQSQFCPDQMRDQGLIFDAQIADLVPLIISSQGDMGQWCQAQRAGKCVELPIKIIAKTISCTQANFFGKITGVPYLVTEIIVIAFGNLND